MGHNILMHTKWTEQANKKPSSKGAENGEIKEDLFIIFFSSSRLYASFISSS